MSDGPRNQPLVRNAVIFPSQSTCAIALGDEGIWNNSGTLKYRDAAGSDTSLGADGNGDMLLGTVQTVTALKTFVDGKFKQNNAAGTFGTIFSMLATAARTWIFPDASDTVVGLAATQELTNKTLTAQVVKTGLTASGSASNDFSGSTGTFKPSSGIFTHQGKQAAGAATNLIADPGGANGAIPVTTSGVCAITTAAAETSTLADPTFVGQRLAIICDVYAVGDRVITAASDINQAGDNIMTFGAVGDMIELEGMQLAGVKVWRVIANDGVALS